MERKVTKDAAAAAGAAPVLTQAERNLSASRLSLRKASTTSLSSMSSNVNKSGDATSPVASTDGASNSETIDPPGLSIEETAPFFKFVLTGGPCGGKTTALARLFSYLRERGMEVITCPEAYTMLKTNGMSSQDIYAVDGMDRIIQGAVLDIQMNYEDCAERILRARNKPSVILCDRGTMDGSVYISDENFAYILNQRSTNIVQLRDNRYDAIFHLVTAANGAVSYYTLDNNEARTETPEEAVQVDNRTQQMWVGHPHLYVFDNSTDFEGKMRRLVNMVSRIVGLPSNLTRQSVKYLLKSPPNLQLFPPNVPYQLFEIEKVYLRHATSHAAVHQPMDGDSSHNSDHLNDVGYKYDGSISSLPPLGGGNHPPSNEPYSFIRKRTSIDAATGAQRGTVYQLTTVQYIPDAATGEKLEMIEEKRIITSREYMSAYSSARDPTRHIIKQQRISFLYKLQSFVIHCYSQPVSGLYILHAQVEGADSTEGDTRLKPQVDLPPYLDVDRRIEETDADNERYGAYNISLMNKR
jgi:predicted ATPase